MRLFTAFGVPVALFSLLLVSGAAFAAEAEASEAEHAETAEEGAGHAPGPAASHLFGKECFDKAAEARGIPPLNVGAGSTEDEAADDHGGDPEVTHATRNDREIAASEHGAHPATEPAPDAHAEPAPDADGAHETIAISDQPYALIRTLESVQDQIARGNRHAHINQRELIGVIEKKLLEVPEEVWRDPRNTRAGIIYALSGGSPRVLQRLLDIQPLPCVDDNLLKGLLAYTRGLSGAAKARLADIDPLTLGDRAAAHLAMAQAMLIVGETPNKAVHYLDLARILAPGTLLEEAALRRETVIAALIQENGKFEMLTSQYLRRFGESVYAPEFISRMAVAVATGPFGKDIPRFEKFMQMVDGLNDEQRRNVHLAIAQAAIVRGQVALARVASERLAQLASDNPALRLQAELYEAAANVLSDDKYEQAVAWLRNIDRRALSARDTSLLDAALDLAVRLRLPPQGEGAPAEPPPVSDAQGRAGKMTAIDDVIKNAKAALGTADDLLNGERR